MESHDSLCSKETQDLQKIKNKLKIRESLTKNNED